MKRVHPLLSYAFLLGAGTIAISATSVVALPETATPTPLVVITPYSSLPTRSSKRETWPADLVALKNSGVELKLLLSELRNNIDTLAERGRIPPPSLIDDIGMAEQLIAMIEQAQEPMDIGIFDASERLRAITTRIMANSNF